MKVVHVNFWEKQGGAAIAANRLHKAMLASGLDSKMIVYDRQTNDESVFSVKCLRNSIKIFLFNILSSRLLSKFRPYIGNFSISILGLNFSNHELLKNADVIYIHWINNSFMSISSIQKLLNSNKRIVWFLHDMWPLTGGCHHSFNCSKYQKECGKCDLLKSQKNNDIAFRQFLLKKKLMHFDNLSIVSPSAWLSECVKKSTLFKQNKVYTIPNLINTDIFKPCDKANSRQILNLPINKKLILFGADMGVENPYKGWVYLKNALDLIDPNFELVTFGSSYNSQEKISLQIHNFGKLYDTYSLILLYSACDVFVTPSLADNFPNTIMESLSCGVPVVGFDVGGIPEMIVHKKTGYLAKYMDAKDLANGISWVLQDVDISELSLNCRKYVLANFETNEVMKMHNKLLI